MTKCKQKGVMGEMFIFILFELLSNYEQNESCARLKSKICQKYDYFTNFLYYLCAQNLE